MFTPLIFQSISTKLTPRVLVLNILFCIIYTYTKYLKSVQRLEVSRLDISTKKNNFPAMLFPDQQYFPYFIFRVANNGIKIKY